MEARGEWWVQEVTACPLRARHGGESRKKREISSPATDDGEGRIPAGQRLLSGLFNPRFPS